MINFGLYLFRGHTHYLPVVLNSKLSGMVGGEVLGVHVINFVCSRHYTFTGIT